MTESKSIKCGFCNSLFFELKRFESHLIHDYKEINITEKIKEFRKAKELIILNNKDDVSFKKIRKSKKDLKKIQKK